LRMKTTVVTALPENSNSIFLVFIDLTMLTTV
jgi:hypothetical protein